MEEEDNIIVKLAQEDVETSYNLLNNNNNNNNNNNVNLSPVSVMKASRVCRGTAPLILNLGTRSELSASRSDRPYPFKAVWRLFLMENNLLLQPGIGTY